MKKPLRYMLSVVLMLALMLSMGTAAFADKTDSELPVEYVTYGVGLPDAPGVDRHELGDDDITIDGVSWRQRRRRISSMSTFLTLPRRSGVHPRRRSCKPGR